MIDEHWLAFIGWCEKNPYSTIERLEIIDGKPDILIIKRHLSPRTIAFVKIKYDKVEREFNNK